MNRRHADGKATHNLSGDSVGILSGLRFGDAILEPGDYVVAPISGRLVGKLVGRQAHRYPELHLVEAPGLQGKLKAARHYADDGVSFAVQNDGVAEDVRIELVAIQPRGITDHRERLMAVLFLLGKEAAQNRANAEGWEDACREPGRGNFF